MKLEGTLQTEDSEELEFLGTINVLAKGSGEILRSVGGSDFEPYTDQYGTPIEISGIYNADITNESKYVKFKLRATGELSYVITWGR